MPYALILSALADPTRRALVRRLRRKPRTVQELAAGMPVSRPAVSQHLQVLRAAGLVRSRQAGTRRFYRLDPRGFAELRAWLDRFLDEKDPENPEGETADGPSPVAPQISAETTAAPHASAELTIPLRKSFGVPCPPASAFRLFTQGIASWWPLSTHSLSGADAASCTIEGRPGGRVFERSRLGRPLLWGQVLEWEPPRRLVFTWHPGREPETAQEVEVTFRDAGSGAALVELEHRHWDRLGEDGYAAREDFDRAWEHVLGVCYVNAVQAAV